MLVSIVIPVYNADRYLEECIKSVFFQSYAEWELILVNDGSSDRSKEICESFAFNNEKVRVVHQVNAGVSEARNRGICLAKGEFICFVDSDDMIAADFLEKMVTMFIYDTVDVVYSQHQLDYNGRRISRVPRIKEGYYTFDEIKGKAIDDGTMTGILFGSVCGAMYKLERIKARNILFEKEVKKNEDGLFNLVLLQQSRVIGVSNYCGYIYRQWKNHEKAKLEWDYDLEKSSAIIRNRCINISNVELQLRARKISILFWQSIKIQRTCAGFKECMQYLKKNFSNDQYELCWSELDYVHMQRYKRILCNMMKRKQRLLFFVAVRYIAPFLSKYIVR